METTEKQLNDFTASADNSIVHQGRIRGAYNCRMIKKAIEEGWEISASNKSFVVEQMQLILKESKSPRNRMAAAKVLVAMTGVNARLMSIDQKAEMGPNQINILNQMNQIGGEQATLDEADLSKLTVEELLAFRKLQEKVASAPGS